MHDVHLKLDGPRGGTITIGGQDVSRGVRGVTLQHAVNEVPQLVLDVVAAPVVIEGEAAVHITPATAELLLHLGWTPPADQPIAFTDATRHEDLIEVVRREVRRDPEWFARVLRKEARRQGGDPDLGRL
jgi:hypothetical protein